MGPFIFEATRIGQKCGIQSNLPKFVRDWPDAVTQDFTKLYAIVRRNSKVTAKQFEHFCREIGVRIQLADPARRALFELSLIEDIFLVEEYAFDATKLASWAERELREYGVQIRFETRVRAQLRLFWLALFDKHTLELRRKL